MSIRQDRKAGWGMGAAVGAAVVASACCTIPLLLVTMGVGGAWVSTLTALEPFRPYFVTLAVGFLGFAAYRLYQQSRVPDCDCEEEAVSLRTRQMLLGVAALLTLGLIASPQFLPESPTGETVQAQAVALSASMQEVTLEIEGMTCAACATTVATALNRLDGVVTAQVTDVPPRAIVRYDETSVSIEELTNATANAGYPSLVVVEPSSP